MKLRLKSTRFTLLFSAAILCSILAAMILPKPSVSALSALDYNYGNIIDDGVFYNKNTMSVQQIQDFLNRLIPNCDTWGTSPSEYGGGTRAQYAASRGWHGPPYACLNNYHENPSTGETSFEKGGGAFAGGISAAQIIYDAAQTYGINPQVLLVLLKKESAGPLTADTWPLKSQYRYAMGYACPDSGPGYSANCDDGKAGFNKQMNLAAWQLKYYKDHPNDYRYGIGWNDIQYSPNPACGTRHVFIENIATLSLYIYTPYVPNHGALANYPGTAHCGAYGNRNFFMFFSEWFGGTRYIADFSRMDTPRFLTPSQANVRKINLITNQETDAPLNPGQTIYFTEKTVRNGEWCLRTRFDRDSGNPYCIPFSLLNEVPVSYAPIAKQKVRVINPEAYKINPVTESTLDVLSLNQTLAISQKFNFNGIEYYRSTNDVDSGHYYGIRTSDVEVMNTPHILEISDVTLSIKEKDRSFKTDIWSHREATNLQPLSFGQSVTFSATTTINGILYYISKLDYSEQDSTYAVDSRILNLQPYTSLAPPRDLRVINRTCKVNLDTSIQTNLCYSPNTILSFNATTEHGGKIWYRTAWETTYNTNLVINPDDISPL